MKKIIALVAIVALTATATQAQKRTTAFGQNDLMWNFGYGIVGGVFDKSSDVYTTVINPISISAEYGVISFGNFMTLGVGAYLSGNYADVKVPVLDKKYYLGSIVAAGRVALHFNLIGILDLGVGANIGYNIGIMRADQGLSSSMLPEDKSEFAWAPYASARFMITPSFGIFGEAGFGNLAKKQDNTGTDRSKEATFVNIGLSFNF